MSVEERDGSRTEDLPRGLGRLVAIMRRLLGPDGCPWDRAQTHRSLRPYLVEETYEVLDAIESGDPDELRHELGDLLLQVVFHAELARREGSFDIEDVAEAISDKLERRHPHVFGGGQADSPAEVAAEWQRLKRAEGGSSGVRAPSRSMPALRRGHRLGERLAAVGFDWPDPAGPRAKVDEELSELDEAVESGDPERVEAEIGDLLLAVSNLSRHLGHEGEDALRAALERLERRFGAVERRLATEGREARSCTLDELEALWQAEKDREGRGIG